MPVHVVSVDATKAGKNFEGLKTTVENKFLAGRKQQADEVIVYTDTSEQAAEIAKYYEGRSDVRVMHPASSFDSGRVSTGPISDSVRLPKTLGVVGDMAFALDFPVNVYNEGFGNATNDLIDSIADPLGPGLSCMVTGCGPAPEA